MLTGSGARGQSPTRRHGRHSRHSQVTREQASCDKGPTDGVLCVRAGRTARHRRQLASGFSALADPVRLRVLIILAASPEGEVCVCDFVEPLAKSQPTVSHHLKVLSEAGLVEGDRRGK